MFYSTVCPSFPIPLSGEGTISSPNYPMSNYLPRKNCYWHITAAAGKVVRVNITDFAMGVCDDCSSGICSYVEFYDGPTRSSSSLGRFCTGSQRTAKISSGTEMFVHFYSSFSLDRGFQAVYAESIPGKLCQYSIEWSLYRSFIIFCSSYSHTTFIKLKLKI